jgi:hypothetical protein
VSDRLTQHLANAGGSIKRLEVHSNPPRTSADDDAHWTFMLSIERLPWVRETLVAVNVAYRAAKWVDEGSNGSAIQRPVSG